MVENSELIVYVNSGKVIREANPDPLESLISLLRRHGFTGTKLGCSEGICKYSKYSKYRMK